MDNIYASTPRKIQEMLPIILEAGLVPYIVSSPGMGKSSIVRELAHAHNLKLIDFRLSTADQTDFNGLPGFSDGFAKMMPFEELFPLSTTAIPEGYAGWVLFLDEFPAASREVQAAAFQLILDRQVGQHLLHENCVIICAGNHMSDRSIVNPISTAMQSRLIHLTMELDFQGWLEDVGVKHSYHPTILAYLMANNSDLMTFSPNHKDSTFACPRTWQFMNSLVQATGGPVEYMLPAYAGAISEGLALKYFQFCKVFHSLVSVADILTAPETAPVPTDAASKWAVICNLIEQCNVQNGNDILTYIDRFDMAFKIVFLRGALSKHPEFRRLPKFSKVCLELAQLLN